MRKQMQLETASLHRLVDVIDDVIGQMEVASPVTVHLAAGRDQSNDAEKAALARSLLRAAELASLLASELHVRYWGIKGLEDPRTAAGTPAGEVA
jgi:hypothetical protein